MDKKPEDVESDVFRKSGPAEQLEESVEEGNQEADESGDIDGVKRFDEVGSRVIAAVIGPAVLEERMKMRISAEGELKLSSEPGVKYHITLVEESMQITCSNRHAQNRK